MADPPKTPAGMRKRIQELEQSEADHKKRYEDMQDLYRHEHQIVGVHEMYHDLIQQILSLK